MKPSVARWRLGGRVERVGACHDEVANVLEILVKVLLTLVPKEVIEMMDTMMISANMTAYSTAVGPSSRRAKSMTAFFNLVNIRLPLQAIWQLAGRDGAVLASL
jgi:hypothetical protein